MKKDYITVGGFALAFLTLLILARERPLTDRDLGAKWCHSKGLAIDKAYQSKTARPPYHIGEFKAQTKLNIICKKKALH